MNDTVLGAVIGACAAILGGVVTSALTYFANKRHEEIKERKKHKESLYHACVNLHAAMYLYLTAVVSAEERTKITFDLADLKYENAMTEMEIITSMYINEIDIEKIRSSTLTFLSRYVLHVRPNSSANSYDISEKDDFKSKASEEYSNVTLVLLNLKRGIIELEDK